MDERFKIYVDQLHEGYVETLSESFSPEFLDVHEKDLKFVDPVDVQGEAYLADDMLVLHIDIHTIGMIPCAICNEPVKVEVTIPGSYHAIPLDEIKGGIYNFQEILRETILLEVPILAECNQGKCPQRSAFQKYLKEERISKSKNGDEDGYHPFADLDIDRINKDKLH